MSEISQELAQRMAEHLRHMAKTHPIKPGWTGKPLADWEEMQALVADLPVPVDPDLIEAREIVVRAKMEDDGELTPEQASQDTKFGTFQVDVALAAIKRGRELERSGK